LRRALAFAFAVAFLIHSGGAAAVIRRALAVGFGRLPDSFRRGRWPSLWLLVVGFA